MLLDDFDCDYEEIQPEEVQRVVMALKELQASIRSQTIREFLADCSTDIFYLVNDDEAGEFEHAA